MYTFIFIIASVLAFVAGQSGEGHGHKDTYIDYHGHPVYKFNYHVYDSKTKDEKKQTEERDGDTLKGYYTVVQPDHKIRKVHYTADKEGFKAHVTYEDYHGTGGELSSKNEGSFGGYSVEKGADSYGYQTYGSYKKEEKKEEPKNEYQPTVIHYQSPVEYKKPQEEKKEETKLEGYEGESYKFGGFGEENSGFGGNNLGFEGNSQGFSGASQGFDGDSGNIGGSSGYEGFESNNFGPYADFGQNNAGIESYKGFEQEKKTEQYRPVYESGFQRGLGGYKSENVGFGAFEGYNLPKKAEKPKGYEGLQNYRFGNNGYKSQGSSFKGRRGVNGQISQSSRYGYERSRGLGLGAYRS